MKSPTQILRDEHTLILRALDVLEAGAARAAGAGALPERWWSEVVDWLRRFADRTHHRKEEDLLFPAMVAAGMVREAGPIAVMLQEHEEGRRLIGAIATATAEARGAAARAYVRLLRAHIDKENAILFPLADEIVDEATHATLGREFERVGDEVGREGSAAYAEERLGELAAALTP